MGLLNTPVRFLMSRRVLCKVFVEFYHQTDSNFIVKCNVNGCPKTYSSVKSLRQHMRLKHRNEYLANCNSNDVSVSDVFDVLPNVFL